MLLRCRSSRVWLLRLSSGREGCGCLRMSRWRIAHLIFILGRCLYGVGSRLAVGARPYRAGWGCGRLGRRARNAQAQVLVVHRTAAQLRRARAGRAECVSMAHAAEWHRGAGAAACAVPRRGRHVDGKRRRHRERELAEEEGERERESRQEDRYEQTCGRVSQCGSAVGATSSARCSTDLPDQIIRPRRGTVGRRGEGTGPPGRIEQVASRTRQVSRREVCVCRCGLGGGPSHDVGR